MREINSTEFNFYLDRKAIIQAMHDHSIKEFKIGDRASQNDTKTIQLGTIQSNDSLKMLEEWMRS